MHTVPDLIPIEPSGSRNLSASGSPAGRTSTPRSRQVLRLVVPLVESQAEVFARLAQTLHGQPTLADTLGKVVESAAALIDCDHAGMLVLSKGHTLETFTLSNLVAQNADTLQVESQEGPAVAAVGEGRTILVPDISAEVRWPRWTAGMRDLNLSSALGVPLGTTRQTLGVLTLYARVPGWFDPEALVVAEVVGRHASIALANARQQETLRRALDTRTLIGQAQGILMERYSLDADNAFAVLRRYSQHTNMKLNEIAGRLVQTGALPTY